MYNASVVSTYTFLKQFKDGNINRYASANNSMSGQAVRYNILNYYATYCEFDWWNYSGSVYRGWVMNNFGGYGAY